MSVLIVKLHLYYSIFQTIEFHKKWHRENAQIYCSAILVKKIEKCVFNRFDVIY